MTFEEACREKFRRGQIEHHGRWEDIQPSKEIQEELCDAANYYQHPKYVAAHPIKSKMMVRLMERLWEAEQGSDCP